MYKTVVLFKCEDKNDAPLMAKKLKDLEMVIDEIDTFQVNLDVLGTANSYDFCLEGTFSSSEDYQAYLIHSKHIEYVNKMRELGVNAIKVCFEE